MPGTHGEETSLDHTLATRWPQSEFLRALVWDQAHSGFWFALQFHSFVQGMDVGNRTEVSRCLSSAQIMSMFGGARCVCYLLVLTLQAVWVLVMWSLSVILEVLLVRDQSGLYHGRILSLQEEANSVFTLFLQLKM